MTAINNYTIMIYWADASNDTQGILQSFSPECNLFTYNWTSKFKSLAKIIIHL